MAGASETTVTIRNGQPWPTLYLQALANTGSATFVISATGFVSSEFQVNLSGAGVTVLSPEYGAGISVGSAGRLKYSLCEVMQSGGQTYCALVRAAPQMPPVTVETTASDTTVLQITEPKTTLTIANQDSWSFGVKVLRTGSSRVRVMAQPLSGNNAAEVFLNFF